MRAHEIIRGILDLLDQIDGVEEQHFDAEPIAVTIEAEPQADNLGDTVRRFQQIAGILDQSPKMSVLANSPDEAYADVDAVTVLAGGGVNGPKHPHDIRLKDPSQHPNQQDY